jgi:aspartate-semialdehyde dehydrogenase
MNGRIPVAVLAATGTVGQRFVQLLENHPWFEVTVVTGSERTVGGRYGEGVNWVMPGRPPAAVADLIVQPTEPNLNVPVVFSALPTAEAREMEPVFAASGYVVVPMLRLIG